MYIHVHVYGWAHPLNHKAHLWTGVDPQQKQYERERICSSLSSVSTVRGKKYGAHSYTHTHTHTRAHTHTHTCARTRIHTHTHARMHAHTHTHARMHAHAHAHTRNVIHTAYY